MQIPKRPRRYISNQERNINAATLATLFFAAQIFTYPTFSVGLASITVLCAVWGSYEWLNWFQTRRRTGCTKVATLAQILHLAFADVGNSYLLLSIVPLLPCFILVGAVLSGLQGAVLCLGFGLFYVACMYLLQRYPLHAPGLKK